MEFKELRAFDEQCSAHLADAIKAVLRADNAKKIPALGFITTDDFYGFYLCWDYSNSDINEYFEWGQASYPDFLYDPLVDALEACDTVDFTEKSDEKWSFALALLSILEKQIKRLPDAIFEKNNYRREGILFFATMSDGDYIYEMLDTSVALFNSAETVAAYRSREGIR